MMADETWISGAEVKDWKLDCEVLPNERQFKVAACLDRMHFNHIPKGLMNMENTKPIEEKVVAEATTEDVVTTE